MSKKKRYYYITEKNYYLGGKMIFGYKNNYFKPTPEILDELKENRIKVYTT